jgi:hypothetical protein
MSFVENYNQFNKWYKEFIGIHGGYNASKEWFKKVQATHQHLREIINGFEKEQDVKTEDIQRPAAKELAAPYIDRLRQLIPNLEKNLDGDFSPLLLPQMQLGQKTLSTGKAIVGWYQRSKNYNTYDRYDVDSNISGLAMQWAKAKSSKNKFTVVMSTRAKAFALLGHYGPDIDSCFHQTGGNDDNKYVLGQTSHTFVLLVKADDKVVARFWGFKLADANIYTLSNLYTEDHIRNGDIFEALRHFFASLLQISYNDLNITHNKGKVAEKSIIYFNGSTWSFAHKDTIVAQHELIGDSSDIRVAATCANCHEIFEDNYDFLLVDNQNICPDCADTANFCDHCQTYTFEKVRCVIDEFSNLIHVHERHIKENYRKCKGCNDYIHKSLIHKQKCDICQESIAA